MHRRILVLAPRRRLMALVSVIGLAIMMFDAAPAAPASADGVVETDTTTITATLDTNSPSGLAGDEVLPLSIVCYVKQETPHIIYKGTSPYIQSIAETSCNSKVIEIAQTQDLLWGGQLNPVVDTDYFQLFDQPYLQTTVEYPCFEGSWSSNVETWVYFPAGYTPNPQTVDKQSPKRTVTTTECNALIPVPDVFGVGEDTAVASITAAHLQLGSTTYIDDCRLSFGDVTRQDPRAFTLVPAGSYVSIWVALCTDPGGGF